MSETKRPTSEQAEAVLGEYYPVLNHGFIALMDYMGTDQTVPTCARTSYGHGTKATSKDEGLVRYLRRHMHTSPFEFVEFHFHCSMPIFVARQWVRHRTASINEVSGRYSLLPMLYYVPEEKDFAFQSKDNKQGRGEVADGAVYQEAIERWRALRARTQSEYEWLIGEEVARELARIDLPLSTYTQWRWKIDGHNLMHFLSLRCDPHAQWEIRVYANIIAGILERGWPTLFNAWQDYNLKAHKFSRQEMLLLCKMIRSAPEGMIASMDSLVSLGQNGVLLTPEELSSSGLSNREIEGFTSAFNPMNYEKTSFLLPEPKPFSYFEEMAAAAVPRTENA